MTALASRLLALHARLDEKLGAGFIDDVTPDEMASLTEAAAALSGGEAVAWGFYDRLGHLRIQKSSTRQYANRKMFPLYTTPPQGDGVVVPKRATAAQLDAGIAAMLKTGIDYPSELDADAIYAAMIAAAPSAEGV